ncbi:Putative phage protein [Lacticaseibacillus paracasei]|jgi:hypothetical protein|uniref:hypothetical protein n=1 Tax=Lacticaseibacillus paracasei TaxID=1597 RepID=UPI00035562B0|nr:hypothetical protein [Lacticaseibacillus paracasei]AGP69137.1 Putative phage protein [Lacticaseibacillus paracasei]
MKIKIWLDDQNRLTNWAYQAEDATVGPTEDGQQIIEADDVSHFFEGHASLVDGKIVADEGYDPANDHPLPGPSPEQQMIAALALEVAHMKAVKSSD